MEEIELKNAIDLRDKLLGFSIEFIDSGKVGPPLISKFEIFSPCKNFISGFRNQSQGPCNLSRSRNTEGEGLTSKTRLHPGINLSPEFFTILTGRKSKSPE